MISVFTDLLLLDLKTLLVPLNLLSLHTAQSQGTMLGKSAFGLSDFYYGPSVMGADGVAIWYQSRRTKDLIAASSTITILDWDDR
jgi:hypothetical protein